MNRFALSLAGLPHFRRFSTHCCSFPSFSYCTVACSCLWSL